MAVNEVTISELPDTDEGRSRVNQFFARYHDTKTAVPTLVEEQAAYALLSGLPRPITMVATTGDGSIVGAITAWIKTERADAMVASRGEEWIARWFRRWRIMSHLAVHGSYRRLGLGTSLVQTLEARLPKDGTRGVWGFAEELPVPSAPFYERLGHTILGPGLILVGGLSVGQDPAEGRHGMHFLKLLKAARPGD